MMHWKNNMDCVFIQGETQHDFIPGPAAGGNQENEDLREAIKQNTTCNCPHDEYMESLNDAKIFSSIVKKYHDDTLEDLPHRELIGTSPPGGGSATPLRLPAHTRPDRRLDGQYKAVTRNQPVQGETLHIQRFDKVSHDDYKGGEARDYTNKQIFQMFAACAADPQSTPKTLHVFFVIDTGGKSVEYLMKNGWDYTEDQYRRLLGDLNGGSDIKIVGNNVISPETSGDSAFKKKADARLYNDTYKKFYVPSKDQGIGATIEDQPLIPPSQNKRVNFLCNSLLMYQAHAITRAAASIKSSDFLSDYEISLGFLPHNYMVKQDWSLPDGSEPRFGTTDSKADMNKVTIRKWLEAKRANRGPPRSDYLSVRQSGADLKRAYVPSDWTNAEKETVSLKFQNKRSGDYLQVLMARELFHFKNYLLKVRADESCDYTETYKSFTEEHFQKNTFFVTIDWPAAAFAIYNKVNTIVYYAGSSQGDGCILVFTFPERGQGGGAAGFGRMIDVMGDISSSLFATKKKITGEYSRVKNRTKRNTRRRNSRESKSSRNSKESKSIKSSRSRRSIKKSKSRRNSRGSKSSRNSRESKSSRNSRESKSIKSSRSRRSIKKSKSSIAETEMISPHYMVSRGDKKTMRYFTANRPCHWLFSLLMQDKIRKIKSEVESIKSLTELKKYAIRSGVLEENIRDISSIKNQRDEIIKLIISLTPIALKEEQKEMKGGSEAGEHEGTGTQSEPRRPYLHPRAPYFGSNTINDFWTVIIFIMEDMRLFPDKYLSFEGDNSSEYPGVFSGQCYEIKEFPINYEEGHDVELPVAVGGRVLRGSVPRDRRSRLFRPTATQGPARGLPAVAEEGGEETVESSYLNFLPYVFGRFKDYFDFPVNIHYAEEEEEILPIDLTAPRPPPRLETVSDEHKSLVDLLIAACTGMPVLSWALRGKRRTNYRCVWPDPISYQKMKAYIDLTYSYISGIFVVCGANPEFFGSWWMEWGMPLVVQQCKNIFELWWWCVNNGFGWLSSLKQNLDQSWEMIDRLTLEIVLYKYLYTELLNRRIDIVEFLREPETHTSWAQVVKVIFELIIDNTALSLPESKSVLEIVFKTPPHIPFEDKRKAAKSARYSPMT